MIWETIKIALSSLKANKMRTLLSMLGIIIGVGAVIAVISVAAGSQHQITSRISDMGSNLITISPGITRGRFGYLSRSASDVFTRELGKTIEDYSPSVKRIIPQNQSGGYFMVGSSNYRGNLVGTSQYYQMVNKYYPETGKFFSNYDIENSTSVIVLGQEIVDELFPDQNPLGQTITFYNQENKFVFKIIGIMQQKDRGIAGDLNGNAYIPITTYQNKINNSSRYIDNFLAQAKSSEVAGKAVREIEYFLSRYFEDEEQFSIRSQEEILNTINEVSGSMTLMLSGIAGISLLVGGIGIMNIMLVSVTERTREIGIRKALGARRSYVLEQFLLEALIMSGIGGVIGVLAGGTGAYFIAQIGGWPLILSPSSILLAFGFSLIVGVFFGIYPAVKASKLDPLDALIYE